jgi:hypothetical protein
MGEGLHRSRRRRVIFSIRSRLANQSATRNEKLSFAPDHDFLPSLERIWAFPSFLPASVIPPGHEVHFGTGRQSPVH